MLNIQTRNPMIDVEHSDTEPRSLNLLLIDTSSALCRVGRSVHGQLVGERLLEGENRHSEGLNPMIERLMQETACDFDSLDGVAVINGPGSYTGLRIGAAFAKALVLATHCRLIAVNGLDVLIEQYRLDGHPIQVGDYLIPMVDARRMEVFTQTIRYAEQPLCIHPPGARVLTEASYNDCVGGTRHFMGNGCVKYQELRRGVAVDFSERYVQEPGNRMASMANLATLHYKNGRFVTDDFWQPDYHKEFYYPEPRQKQASSLAHRKGTA
jgi:tRNA threonylcarbamoyladenosine biosynthesis protein TsaB